MYLVDTNVWLERLLKSEEVDQFLDLIPSENLFITDFAFHSIGIVMSKLNRVDDLMRFVQDAFIDGAAFFTHLEPEDTQRVMDIVKQFNLDFDDAYQYTATISFMIISLFFGFLRKGEKYLLLKLDADRTVLVWRLPSA